MPSAAADRRRAARCLTCCHRHRAGAFPHGSAADTPISVLRIDRPPNSISQADVAQDRYGSSTLRDPQPGRAASGLAWTTRKRSLHASYPDRHLSRSHRLTSARLHQGSVRSNRSTKRSPGEPWFFSSMSATSGMHSSMMKVAFDPPISVWIQPGATTSFAR